MLDCHNVKGNSTLFIHMESTYTVVRSLKDSQSTVDQGNFTAKKRNLSLEKFLNLKILTVYTLWAVCNLFYQLTLQPL